MGETPEQKLLAEHRQQVAKVRSDQSLSWEKQELKVRALGLRLSERLKALEEERDS